MRDDIKEYLRRQSVACWAVEEPHEEERDEEKGQTNGGRHCSERIRDLEGCLDKRTFFGSQEDYKVLAEHSKQDIFVQGRVKMFSSPLEGLRARSNEQVTRKDPLML